MTIWLIVFLYQSDLVAPDDLKIYIPTDHKFVKIKFKGVPSSSFIGFQGQSDSKAVRRTKLKPSKTSHYRRNTI